MNVDAQDDLRIVTEDGGTVAYFDCLQGTWTEPQYLRLTDTCNRLLEFTDGRIDVLPMPTDRHQSILQFLFLACLPAERELGGAVRFSPLRLRIGDGRFREPDLLLVRDADDPRRADAFWTGADLVMEVVSPQPGSARGHPSQEESPRNPLRDTRDKRLEYARAGIPEYWIVNPIDETVTVLELDGDTYLEHGIFRRGEQADSTHVPGLAVDVAAVFDAE